MPKPGYLTTEFAALVALAVVAAVAVGAGSDHAEGLIDALMVAIPGYAVSRGIVKARASDVPPVAPEDRPAR